MMDHVNIARVLDAGTIPGEPGCVSAGRPYFVMELVHGIPITKYCDDNRLTPRERLELFVPVCQAIQHAHQKGIIHRDIKPSNVMITLYDGKPVPKVIDFGVAKATEQRLTERTLFTQYGTLVGTFEYMSPEQAEMSALGVDTRSDIYSLGVLLYELLTGSTPLSHKRLKEAAYGEILRMIREEEAPKPSTRLSDSGEALASISAQRHMEPAKLTKLVRGELDWIVMKALEKDRNRRYETATGFAMDVQRYLADEPVLACPPSAGYQLRKFARRHRGPMLAASLVLLALAGGSIGTTVGLIQAEKARQREAGLRRIAEDNEKAAKEGEAETRAVLEFLERNVLAAARPEGQDGGLGRDVTLRKAVEAALPLAEKRFPDQPLIEARLRMTLARSFGNLGEAKLAADQAERAWTIYSKQLGTDHPDTLSSMHGLANCYDGLGRHADALKLREETLALMKAKLGPDHPHTLSAMHNLALSYATLGRHDEALKLNEETLALKKAKLGPDHPATLATMNNLALSHTALGRHAEALKLAQETLALTKAKLGPNHPRTLISMDSLAVIYHALSRHGEAVQLFEETLALMKVKLGPDHPTTLTTMHNLAGSYAGRHGEELKLREETLALRKTKLGPDHPDTLASMSMLARLLATYPDVKVRNPSRAVELAKQAVEREPNAGCWNTLGVAFYCAGDWKASVHAFDKAMELRKAGDSFDWFFLAMTHWQLEDKEEARKWYGQAVEWMDKNQPANEELRRFRAEAAELLKVQEKNN
jgi:tetratricopeptide (TPR) repeat protein